ncbi:MAG TPA: DUF1360 domain-containing protein [Mycobacteriales bacterium]|jgi:hypothetical protein|nr:DUF1360 domain-containing protein [Mycobacteriales bacterium]
MTETLDREVHEIADEYGRPAGELRGYSAVVAVYLTAMSATMWRLKSKGKLPKRFAPGDLALVALATHKLSRTVSKDSVTSPFRAPFAHFEGAGAPGEVKEDVVGEGSRHAIGELLTCPFCMDQWIASAFVTGLAAAPRLTRFAASVLAVRAGADMLQFGYAAANRAAS